MHPERDLVITVAAAGHDIGQVVENAFIEAVHDGEPVSGGKIDPRLPFLSAALRKRLWRNPELHWRFSLASILDLALLTGIVAQTGAVMAEIAAGLPSVFAAPCHLLQLEKLRRSCQRAVDHRYRVC